MSKLLGAASIALVSLAATWHAHSLSGWLLWGMLPALWLDRQFFRLLPWPERKPLAGAVLLRLLYVAAGALLVLPYYPWVPLSEALLVGCGLSGLAFGLEVLLGLAQRRPGSRWRTAGLALALLVPILVLLPLKAFHQFHTRPTRTPQNLGLPFEEVHIRTADGLELAAWHVPHSQPRGGIIFCHGHGGNRSQVLWTLPAMHELGLEVLAFDFRGHGDSPGHTATFGDREVADVLAAEAFLAQRLSDRPLFLAGVSYGGAVSLQALPHLPRIRAAWIDSAFARLTDIGHTHFDHLPPALRGGLIDLYSVILWCDCGFWGPDINPIDRLQDIRIPIHFSHGTADNLVSFRQGRAMYEAYPGPKSCFWIDGATHFTRSSEANTEYLRRFRQFFQAQLLAAGPIQ